VGRAQGPYMYTEREREKDYMYLEQALYGQGPGRDPRPCEDRLKYTYVYQTVRSSNE
jgi:hypothetical protein